MDVNQFLEGLRDGTAKVYLMDRGYVLFSMPERELAGIIMNGSMLFDFTNCKRLTNPEAHRVIDEMDDAPQGVKAVYHAMLDGRVVINRKA